MSIKLAKQCLFAVLLSASSMAMATIQEHTFSISGDNGETGTGSFTWDDAVVPDGSELAGFDMPAELLSISITISGGNVVGGSTSFVRGDCTQAVLQLTPNFINDINFWCDNGTNAIEGVETYSNILNSGSDGFSRLTFAPGTTAPAPPPAPATPVPTMSEWALITLAMLMAGIVFIRRKQLS
ncbi:MAG: IPTL-CTERM sorting domain-containing protein [Proteobacteria bacterium]|nr:IPTL-CTERM sorting domain-containing protein [Pseudomonadota bacterium]